VELLDIPHVVRPQNMGEGVPGRGFLHTTVAGTEVTVLNLGDPCAMRSAVGVADRFYPAYQGWLEADRRGTVIVDYHGDHVIEKHIFARTVDGQAAAVLGTHTHEPTLPTYILPGGTGLVTDVGMTGPAGGVQGFHFDSFVEGLRTAGNPFALPLPVPVRGPIVLGGVVLEIEDGRTRRLERLS
jgi:calcineurin-like phosphoesterase